MARPTSVWSKVSNSSEFTFQGWEQLVGSKRCFHVAGFEELMRELGLNIRPDFIGKKQKIPTEKLADQAVQLVPPQWKDEFGKGDDRRLAEWQTFGVEQVIHCFTGEPVLLQKAMIALIFAELVVEFVCPADVAHRKDAEIDAAYEFLSIEPAVYWVEGFDRHYFNQNLNHKETNAARRSGIQTKLVKSTGQNDVMIFDEISHDRCTCLRETAQGVISALKKTPGIGSKVMFRIFSMRDRGAASRLERVVVTRSVPKIPSILK